MKEFRIRGTWAKVKATCLKDATPKLLAEEGEFKCISHLDSNNKAWAEITTSYGYECIIEEV